MPNKQTMPKFCYCVVTGTAPQRKRFDIGVYCSFSLDDARLSLSKLLIKNSCTSVLSVSVFLSTVKIGIYKTVSYIDNSHNPYPYTYISKRFQCRLHKTRGLMWADFKAVIHYCRLLNGPTESVSKPLSEYVYCLYE